MAEADTTFDRGTLLLASIAGMGAIITLPLSAVAPQAATVTVFSLPLLLAVIGRATGRTSLVLAALALLAVIGVAVFRPDSGVIDVIGAAVVLIGPVVAVILVGAALRQVDVPAAAGFLGAATIAIIGGFAARGIDGATALVFGVALLGLTVVLYRLARH